AAKGEEPLLAAHKELKRELTAMIAARNGVKLDPDRPVIGFARRAATYKRPNLILQDPRWLDKLVRRSGVQLVFSGKAHPADGAGKRLVAELYRYSRDFPESIVFLQNYDLAIARAMVRGCDVWLNNPIRPLEAS